MPACAAVSSAAGLLALLDEPSDELKHHALSHLNNLVHDYWFQISGALGSLEALYEDEDFSHRQLAALVASKVRSAARGRDREALQHSLFVCKHPSKPHQTPHQAVLV
jgi:hypothetical protein